MSMKQARRIKPPKWMTLRETRAVMKALNNGAGEPQALFVGGCVRGALLGLDQDETDIDIDIATRFAPEEAVIRLGAQGIKTIPIGLDHGTVTAVVGARTFEITTLRKDVETDGRHAVVAYTDDWREDALRRDFTMNTLLADADGRVYDVLGQGLADLEARRVVFVGDPAQRIEEDVLRILRFFRFHAYYGQGAPDPAALAACRDAAPKIVTLSRERITQEFLKIVNADDPAGILALMDEAGVLSPILPGDFSHAVLRKLCGLQNRTKLHSVTARLFALVGMDPGQLDALETSLVLSNAAKREISAMGDALNGYRGGAIRSDKELIYFHTRIVAAQAILLRHVLGEDSGNLEAQVALLKSWMPPQLPVTGEDVLAAGVSSGPEVGRILKAVETWWIKRDFTPGREACLEEIGRIRRG
ncbi:MAG: CCA tRNA nucleotidyltransferase [Alphaproteobacteria bacterium]|nr:CCA tRNA nucleotidyltransferase [Alphaproteobacteria bacterium]